LGGRIVGLVGGYVRCVGLVGEWVFLVWLSLLGLLAMFGLVGWYDGIGRCAWDGGCAGLQAEAEAEAKAGM
jgi:hypothetical protein